MDLFLLENDNAYKGNYFLDSPQRSKLYRVEKKNNDEVSLSYEYSQNYDYIANQSASKNYNFNAKENEDFFEYSLSKSDEKRRQSSEKSPYSLDYDNIAGKKRKKWNLEEDYFIMLIYTRHSSDWEFLLPFFENNISIKQIQNRLYKLKSDYKKKHEKTSSNHLSENIYQNLKKQLMLKYNIENEFQLEEFTKSRLKKDTLMNKVPNFKMKSKDYFNFIDLNSLKSVNADNNYNKSNYSSNNICSNKFDNNNSY